MAAPAQESSPTVEDDWMIRPCASYNEEFDDCSSLRGRFHQYFVHGQTTDCSQWKRDHDNCRRWTEKQDKKSGRELVESEKLRRRQRLEPHYSNNVWTRRKTPPDNWSTPLPPEIQQEYETTYLNVKAKEMKGEIPPQMDPSSYCVLM